MPGEQEAAPPTDGNGAEGWWARHPRAHPGIIVWDTSGARGEAGGQAGGFLRGLFGARCAPRLVRLFMGGLVELALKSELLPCLNYVRAEP